MKLSKHRKDRDDDAQSFLSLDDGELYIFVSFYWNHVIPSSTKPVPEPQMLWISDYKIRVYNELRANKVRWLMTE